MPKQGKRAFPPQHQEKQPALEHKMEPKPREEPAGYPPSGKLTGKASLITGADSGIGRAVAELFAKEGSDISVVYYDEHKDARETQRRVERYGRQCLLIPGHIADESFCQKAVTDTVARFGKLDVLVNNAGIHFPQRSLEDISSEQMERTFRVNIFSIFYLTKAVLAHLKEGSAIINTASITAYMGNPMLIDYSSTKGAIVTFTRSMARSLADKGIRVNAVAPGPIWTPLITSFPAEKVSKFGEDTPLGRAGQPDEIAPAFLFLASQDASYMTGQVLHPNGGTIVNG